MVRKLTRLENRSLKESARFLDSFEQAIAMINSGEYEQAEQTVELSIGLLYLLEIVRKFASVDNLRHPCFVRFKSLLKPFEGLFLGNDSTGENLFRRTKGLLYLFRVRCFLEAGDFYSVRHYVRFLPMVFHSRRIEEFLKVSFLKILYPKPYESMVNALCKKYRVKPNLIYALMREESHFKVDVASSAGALGLMQLMPATGKEMAGILHESNIHIPLDPQEESFFIPQINIHLGIFYFSRLLTQVRGDKLKALAAYNGGLSNVWRWSKGGHEASDFLSQISYPETRRYIFKVLSAEYYYDQLYAPEV